MSHAILELLHQAESHYVALQKRRAEGAAGGLSKQGVPPMSTITYDIAATAKIATKAATPATTAPAPKRKVVWTLRIPF